MTPSVRSQSRPSRGSRPATSGPLVAVLAVGIGTVGIGAAGAGTAQADPGTARADTGARIVAETGLAGNDVDITIDSPSLGKRVKARVLLPENWTRDAARTWPVLYAFHGGRDDYTSWARNTDIEAWARDYDVIVVMPEGEDGSYADWYNYGKGDTPKWETFHTAEVRQLIERNYSAGARRAAIGNSSGGAGAVTYAARHPGMFRYVASLSGVLSMRQPGVPAMLMFTNAGNGQDPFAIWGIPWADDANWKAHDPHTLAPKLRGTGIFFSAGTTGRPGPGDPNVAPWDIGLLSEIVVGANNREFKKRLDRLGIPHTAHIYGDGRHNWPAWIRESRFVWPTLMKSIGAKRT